MVEGYTDVIGLTQAGLANVVATCGTALGEKHFEQLSRFAAARDPVVRLRRGGRAGGRASVRVPGEVPDHRGGADHARGARPGRFRRQARRRCRAGRRGVGSAARRVHGAAHGRTSRPVLDRGAVRGGLGGPAGARAAERSGPPLGVRGAARRPRGGLARQRGPVAHPPPGRQARRGRHDDEARHRPRAGRARGAAVDRARRRPARVGLARSTRATSRSPKLRASFVALRDAELGCERDRRRSATRTWPRGSPRSPSSRWRAIPRPSTRPPSSTALRGFVLKARSDELRAQLQKLNPTTDAAYDDLFRQLVEVDGELRRLKERSP